MQTSKHLEFFIQLAKAKTKMARRFDNRLSFHGLGFNDFAIMVQLAKTESGKMRRTDLAELIGLTQSGVTRLLLPMEKLGLVKRVNSDHDARVSYVSLTTVGERILAESLEEAETLSADILRFAKIKEMDEFIRAFTEIGNVVVY